MKLATIAAGATLALLSAGQAFAQAGYPSKPIKLVCVHAPGGTADMVSRLVAEKMSRSLGQQVVVENKPGASTMLGAQAVATSAPDGYTLLMASVTTLSINPSLYAKMPYDAVKDFAPIAGVAAVPSVLAVSPTLPVKSVKELIELLRAHPGKYNFSSPGAGTSPHLAGALFASMAGVDLVHIPYKNSTAAITELMSGQVHMTFESALVPFSRSGKLRPLGIASLQRSAFWPDLPTLAEQGLPGYESIVWYGLVAPAGTPPAIVNKLNAAVNEALASEDVKEKFKTLAGDPMGGTPEDFAKHIKADTVKWAAVIKQAGVKTE